MIEIKDLVTGYWCKGGDTSIVHRNVNLRFEDGEMVSIIGQNGSGKSTLLRTLCGFQLPLGGRIAIDGMDLSSYSEKSLSKLFSVVFTEKIVVDNMRVFDLIATGRAPYTGYFDKIGENDFNIITQAAQQVGIQHLIDKNINELSDGERQKVMIAKSIAQQTPIIILDEPTAFLDFPSKIELNRLLKNLCRELGKVVIMSTHDIEQVLPFADKVCIVTKNDVKCYASTDDSLSASLSMIFSDFGISYDDVTGKFFTDSM